MFKFFHQSFYIYFLKTFNLSACIVVDSGATTTSVYLVIDGKVDESKTQTMHIGGWHVSQFLKQAPPTRDNKVSCSAINGIKRNINRIANFKWLKFE